MKNEHYDVEQRKELRDAMYKKREEMESQKHSWETAESNFNEYKDSHTGTVQSLHFTVKSLRFSVG